LLAGHPVTGGVSTANALVAGATATIAVRTAVMLRIAADRFMVDSLRAILFVAVCSIPLRAG
jgi:hypothetical protein